VETYLSIFGVSLILIAFGLTLTKRWSSDMPIYLIVNIIGCAMTTVYFILQGDIPFLILQLTWGIFATITLINVLKKKRI